MSKAKLAQWYNYVLGIAMLILGLLMMGFFIKEVAELTILLFDGQLKIEFYKVSEIILETFMFFEFVVLTREYFMQDHISLQNFMYIGVTAMLRNLLVYHDDTIGILIQTSAIAILILVLIIYRLSRRYIEDRQHADQRQMQAFKEEHHGA
ncbi:phosphate-starvation-inducible PsiE family protein [Periweissella beninensis]|uniref:Protein PsiE n=1 Tax=Periweissella beninensis TaxID=504936 RepID=A0ABT0VKV9_9LACO|nr:phosphate-starvation-inducible PsiE family protein [Periweissella beninensis]MBM7544281.1 protein PsiE [Periweissella beninensis]MCM2437783.1 phosphate-starvation-inducible PsiE family protein [Periweissella beninensis]MCT4396437.1 phosphate starvation protein [Periweissella beninensis]